ncbi:MAG: CoA pyrophosphatase [Legionellaceae bacterium]|nr:CoA pyrophosphatase [Legionellaceae bacterium]
MQKSSRKEAAVIVLLDAARTEFILTQRSAHLSSHPGEICFPGGRKDMGDRDLRDTALRELQEELGIAADRVEYLLSLGRQDTLTGYSVFPWLGIIDGLAPCQINSHEVACIVPLSLREVLNKDNYRDIEVHRQGWRIKTTQFRHHQYEIWGATAQIMRQLCLQCESIPILMDMRERLEKEQ